MNRRFPWWQLLTLPRLLSIACLSVEALPRTVSTERKFTFQSLWNMAHVLLWSGVFPCPLLATGGHGHLRCTTLLTSTAVLGRPWDGSHKLSEAVDLLEDHLAHITNVIDHLEVEVEGSRAVRLVARVMPNVQVRVLKCLINADTARGIKSQHTVQQVKGVGVGIGEQAGEGLLGHEREIAHVLLGTRRSDAGQSLLVRSAEDVQDLVQLVDIVATLEEWSSAKELSEDTSHRPDIDYSGCYVSTLALAVDCQTGTTYLLWYSSGS